MWCPVLGLYYDYTMVNYMIYLIHFPTYEIPQGALLLNQWCTAFKFGNL